MRNKYTVAFGIRLPKSEFLALQNALAANPGIDRNTFVRDAISDAVSRRAQSGGAKAIAANDPALKTPA